MNFSISRDFARTALSSSRCARVRKTAAARPARDFVWQPTITFSSTVICLKRLMFW